MKKKIAILGCENSHAKAFLKAIKENERFQNVEAIGVYSEEPEAMKRLHEEFGVAMMADYAEAAGKVDGVVITARHGDHHFEYAKPYIESGVPMFIDKPITVKETEAVEFMRCLKASGTRFSGGSSLKQEVLIAELRRDAEEQVGGRTLGGFVRAPYQPDSEYGGFFFYAQHLVEMVCEIFGRFPLSVTARKNGDQLHVLFHYAEYDCVGLFLNRSNQYYAMRVSAEHTKGFEIPMTKEWYYKEFAEFHELLFGGEQKIGYESFIAPVFIMNAIERSMLSGREETVTYIEV